VELPAAAVGKHHDSNDGVRMSRHAKLNLALSVADRGQTNRRTFMNSPVVRNDIQIDHVCSVAICEEMGDRLRINLTGEPDRLPQHMMMLVEQIAQNDCVSAVLIDKAKPQ
jgi:hypothetical protein